MRSDEPGQPPLPPFPPGRPIPPVTPNWPLPDKPQLPQPDVRMPVVVERIVTSVEEALLERRIVTLTGPLDDESVTATAARLLHLDALSGDAVTLRLDSAGGDVAASLVLVDTFGAMRAPVHLVVVGQAVGAAVVVVAAADDSAVYPHARIVLVEPEVPTVQGDATHVDAAVAEGRRLLDAAYDVIARRCGRNREAVAHDARRRLPMTADEAVAYGLVDRVVQPRRRGGRQLP